MKRSIKLQNSRTLTVKNPNKWRVLTRNIKCSKFWQNHRIKMILLVKMQSCIQLKRKWISSKLFRKHQIVWLATQWHKNHNIWFICMILYSGYCLLNGAAMQDWSLRLHNAEYIFVPLQFCYFSKPSLVIPALFSFSSQNPFIDPLNPNSSSIANKYTSEQHFCTTIFWSGSTKIWMDLCHHNAVVIWHIRDTCINTCQGTKHAQCQWHSLYSMC